MITRIILICLLLPVLSFGQQHKFDCEKTLNKTPYLAKQTEMEHSNSLQMDYDILKSCGNLDSIDIGLLNGPMLASIILEHTTHDREITYNSILKSIDAFKKTDKYVKVREAMIIAMTLERKIVTLEEFEKDKELLIKVGLTELEVEKIRIFIQANASQKMTYVEVFTKYSEAKRSTQTQPAEKIKFNELVDIESAIKAGKESGRKVLLFFSGYACVNAKKVEDYMLTNNQVKSLLDEKFICFIAYVDDRSEDKATNSTVGKKNMKLQENYFKTNYQPYFYIIDNQGKVLSEIDYTVNTQEFITFLNKGLK